MKRFQKFEKYISDNTKADSRSEYVFYKIEDNEIEKSEEKLQILFPKELRDFYTEIGYGFVRPDKSDLHDFINRIMSPIDIVSFLNNTDVYKNDERRNYYNDINKLPFYEVSESSFLTVNLGENARDDECKIYYYNTKIADSFLEFLDKMKIEADYYIEDEDDEDEDE